MYDKLFNWSLIFLRFLIKPSKIEVIEGDLIELFELRTTTLGKGRATFRFMWDVIRFLRLRYIKGLEDIRYLNSLAMIKNYFKIAGRNLLRHKFFAGINIAGLAIGISCCFLIVLFIKHELSYDQFFKNHNRIMRLSLNGWGATPGPFVYTAKEEYPEIEEVLRIARFGEVTFKYNESTFSIDKGLYTDSSFFNFFDWELIDGNPASALSQPNSVVLTKSVVRRFFNRENIIGQIIKIDGVNRMVTGITEDFPANSHIEFNYLIPLNGTQAASNTSWTANNFYSYIKLKEGSSPEELEEKFKNFVRKHMAGEILNYSGHTDYDAFLADKDSRKYTFLLFPIKDIHLNHRWMNMTTPANIENIYTFSIIAVFVLLIACINFMNLSTARSGTRSKEVGIRKVLGSMREQLTLQFLTESILISLFAVVISLFLVLSLLPHFNELSGKNFTIADVLTPLNLIILLALGIITGMLAGMYPAFYLAAIKPITALKGTFKLSGNSFLRKGLVTFQFAISIFLIICTVIVFGQVYFMSNKSVGINTAQTMVLGNAGKTGKNIGVLRDKLMNLSEVNSVSLSNGMPSTWVPNWTYYNDENGHRELSPDHLFVTKEHQEVLGIEMRAGDFFKGRVSDTASVVVNESLLKKFDWSLEDAIGKTLKRDDTEVYRIAGVMKDFHLSSFRNEIRPLLFRYMEFPENSVGGGMFMFINVSGNFQKVIDELAHNWNLLTTDEVLNYSFLDKEFDSLYDSERNFGKIFTTFSVLAIFIACLGLFALSAFILQQRLKEVAMRKVLGASIYQIVGIFVKSFIVYIAIGAVIAVISAYWLANDWLSNFAFRMGLNPLYFFIPVIFVTFIALTTIALQVFKSGNVNPATLLKDE